MRIGNEPGRGLGEEGVILIHPDQWSSQIVRDPGQSEPDTMIFPGQLYELGRLVNLARVKYS